MKKLLSSLAVGGILTCSGCLKNESKSVINPDGSGKFTMTMEMDLRPLLMFGAGSPELTKAMGDPDQLLTQMIRGMGPTVDAWTEAKAETPQQGVTRVTLSGFTRDFTAGGDLKKVLQSSGNTAALDLTSLPDMKLVTSTKDADGNWTIGMAGLDDLMKLAELAVQKGAESGNFKAGMTKVSKADVEAKLQEFRAQYPTVRAMAAGLLQGMNLKYEMQVAGEIQSAAVFKKTAPDTVTYSFNGEQLLKFADGIINDKALAGKVVTLADAFNEGPESDKPVKALRAFLEPYVKEIFGGATAPKVVIKPAAKALFDYPAEVAKAKANMSPELKKLVGEAAQPAAALQE